MHKHSVMHSLARTGDFANLLQMDSFVSVQTQGSVANDAIKDSSHVLKFRNLAVVMVFAMMMISPKTHHWGTDVSAIFGGVVSY